MNKNFKWYLVLTLSFIALILYAGYFLGEGESFFPFGQEGTQQPPVISTNNQTDKLQIPPLLEDKNPEPGKAEFDLYAKHGKTTFFQGFEVDTLGYNGNYLGPVIRVERGYEVTLAWLGSGWRQ